MALVNTLTEYCEKQFNQFGECRQCTHPSGKCSGSCRTCSEQITFHKDGRADYNCQKFVYYYVCRYSWKYCSEIMYALEQINLSAYPAYNILSIGCGGTPDLMAFDEKRSAWDMTELFYTGYDINPYWKSVHDAINQYTNSEELMRSEFINKDIFEAIREENQFTRHYNIIILEYFLSHFLQQGIRRIGEKLFDGLIVNILANRLDNSPFLFLINDIDHYEVRKCFRILIQKLQNAGYHGSVQRHHFGNRESDYQDGSTKYSTNYNKFSIPDKMKGTFDCAISCTSAQLIVEVEKNDYKCQPSYRHSNILFRLVPESN
jgi:hypothetical protein